jgi:exo-beta-1,3-glucanase (GH17 family)
LSKKIETKLNKVKKIINFNTKSIFKLIDIIKINHKKFYCIQNNKIITDSELIKAKVYEYYNNQFSKQTTEKNIQKFLVNVPQYLSKKLVNLT